MPLEEPLKWYAIYTNPRAEKKVDLLLKQKGITSYLPLQTTIKQWSDRKKKVEEPLFKSYVFVNIQFEKDHLTVLNTAGVVKFIRIGKDLASIRHEIIDALKLTLLHYTDILVSSDPIHEKQSVEIMAGPLRGLKGLTLQQQGNHYFSIEIEQLGTYIAVKVPVNYLRPL
jgi:transcriptional antiterminator RfaH